MDTEFLNLFCFPVKSYLNGIIEQEISPFFFIELIFYPLRNFCQLNSRDYPASSANWY